jgi:hypothetical protein
MWYYQQPTVRILVCGGPLSVNMKGPCMVVLRLRRNDSEKSISEVKTKNKKRVRVRVRVRVTDQFLEGGHVAQDIFRSIAEDGKTDTSDDR